MIGKKLFTTLGIMAVLTGSSSSLSAQQVTKITIPQAVDLGLKNSKNLKASAAKINEAEAALKEAKENRLPDGSVSGSYIRLNSPDVDLKVKMNSGGNGSPAEEQGKISSAVYGIVNLSLPIYSGGKIKYGIESARYLAEASRLDEKSDKEAVVLNIINAFENLYKAKAAVELVRENLGGATERVKQFTSLERNGVIPRNDLLKAELQVSNIEVSLMDAENNWKLANINMNLLLGLPEATSIDPDISWNSNPEKLEPVETLMAKAMEQRKDLSAIGLRKKAAGSGAHAVKSEMYPSLALTGGYIAADIPNLLTVVNAMNVGVGVKYSISSLWKNNSKYQQAKARQVQTEAEESALADKIKYEVHEAYLGYLLAFKKIDSYNKAVGQAAENYKIVKNKYDNTLATTTDLLDADIARLQTKLNYAFSQADAATAYSKLLRVCGQLDNEFQTANN